MLSPHERLTASGKRMKMKVVQVGLGRWGRKLLPRLCLQSEVRWCVSTSAPEFSLPPGCRHSRSLAAALADDEVEAVVIATPTDTHAQLALQAAAAGKHIFVEKPLASSTAEAEEVLRAAKSAGVRLFVGHVFLYSEAFAELQKTTNGRLTRVSGAWWKWGTFDSSVLSNLGSHQISESLCLFADKPERVSLEWFERTGDRVDMVRYKLRFPTGEARFELDRRYPERARTLRAFTSDGDSLLVHGRYLFRLEGEQLITLHEARKEPLDREIEAMIRYFRAEGSVPSDGTHGLEVVRVVEALERSMN